MKIGSLFRGDGLRSRSLRSSFFTILNTGSENVLRLAGNLVLTRILFPEAFGIMALVQVVMIGLKMFSDLGLQMSIIQNERGTDPLFLDSAWVLQIARGILLWLATVVMAAPVAALYDTPILAQLLPVAGLIACIQGLNSTKLATANRSLVLGRVTAIKIGSKIIGLATLIGLALWWQSVWALVIGGLIEPLFFMVMSHLWLPGHQNRFRFERTALGELFNFGKYIFLSTIAGFILLQADRAILGKFISLTDLALYNIAFMLATLPRMLQYQIIGKVLYPLYSSRPPGESASNYKNIARARFLVVGCSVLIVAIFAIGGNALIVFLYDPRYEAAGPLLILMALALLPNLITGSYATMIVSRGHSGRYAAFLSLSALVQVIILFFAVSQFGVIGAAFTPLVASLLLYPVLLVFIAPYKGWIMGQDIGFTAVGVVIAAIAVWVNQDILRMTVELFPFP